MKTEKIVLKNLFSILLIIFCSKILTAQSFFSQSELIKNEISSDRYSELSEAEILMYNIQQSNVQIEQNDKTIYQLNEKQSTYSNKELKLTQKRIEVLEENSKQELLNIGKCYLEHYLIIYSVYAEKITTYKTIEQAKRLKVNKLLESAKAIKVQLKKSATELGQQKNLLSLKKQINEIRFLHAEGIDYLNECFCTFINCYERNNYEKATADLGNDENINYSHSKSKNIVIYKIQIMATSEQKKVEDLQRKYSIKTIIQEDYTSDDRLYKYMVGEYSDYYVAKNVSENLGVKDAFVVGYVNGKRVAIDEAIQVTED